MRLSVGKAHAFLNTFLKIWNCLVVTHTHTHAHTHTRTRVHVRYNDCIPCKNPTFQKMISWLWHQIVSDGKNPVLQILRVWSIPTMPLLPGPQWFRIVIPVKVSSMGRMNLIKNYLYSIRPCAKKKQLHRLWRRSLTRSNKKTSMGHSRSCWNGTTSASQPEKITRVSCVYYQ